MSTPKKITTKKSIKKVTARAKKTVPVQSQSQGMFVTASTVLFTALSIVFVLLVIYRYSN
jgi:hypothetical protein